MAQLDPIFATSPTIEPVSAEPTMKHYLVLWAGIYDTQWRADGLFDSEDVATAKLEFERLAHPTWRHAMVEIDVPELGQRSEGEAA
jgi:hypothetical protein